MSRTAEWEKAGRAWGSHAVDWAYLFEPYALPANDALMDAAGVGAGTRLVDIACGSGFAVMVAARRGALVSGLDASEQLIAIARARTPAADLRVGDMFALPFEDAGFDVATSFNGIWAGCEGALAEARRVVRPGGLVGITFWGRPKHMQLLPFFATVAQCSPQDHVTATLDQGETGRPGVAEAMFESVGLEILERGQVMVTNEWPDLDLAVRALCASGPAQPAITNVGLDSFRGRLRTALLPSVSEIGVRLTSELGWLLGRVPG